MDSIQEAQSALTCYDAAVSLFDIIPSRLFSPLSSPKKDIYVAALFVLYDLFQDQIAISRTDVEIALREALDERLADIDFSDEDEDDDGSSPVSAKVQIVISILRRSGWIEFESSSDSFVENVTLPFYSVALIRAMKELTEERIREYNGYVYATYAALRQSDDITDYRLPALNTAYEKTNQFIEELKILYNNIKRYHQRIAKMEDVNELLKDHFDSYYVEIAKKIIEPIRTIDSVPRFKNQILDILDRMENDADILSSLISGGVAKGFYKDDEEAEADIRTKIHSIMDIYSTVERTLSEIDAKHSAYIRSSIERMRYMLSSSRGTKGNLISVLKACRDDTALLQEMAYSIDLVSTKHIDSGSFFDRIARRAKDEGGSEPVARYGENENEIAALFDELRSQYGSEEIDGFILSRMDGDELDSHDIQIEDLDSFLLLILATIRAQEADSPYECHFADGIEERNGGISIAHCIFRRRK